MPERPSKTDQNRPAAIAQSGHFNNPGGSFLDAQGGSILDAHFHVHDQRLMRV
jgi:hypothetical protein